MALTSANSQVRAYCEVICVLTSVAPSPSWDQSWCEIGCCSAGSVARHESRNGPCRRGLRPVLTRVVPRVAIERLLVGGDLLPQGSSGCVRRCRRRRSGGQGGSCGWMLARYGGPFAETDDDAACTQQVGRHHREHGATAGGDVSLALRTRPNGLVLSLPVASNREFENLVPMMERGCPAARGDPRRGRPEGPP